MHPTAMAAATPPDGSDKSGPNRSSRFWILVIGCVIVVALAAAMLMRTGSSSSPNGSGKTQQR